MPEPTQNRHGTAPAREMGWKKSSLDRKDELFLQEILGPPSAAMLGQPDALLKGGADSSGWAGSPSGTSSTMISPTASILSSTQIRLPVHASIKKRRRLLPEETALLVQAFEASQKPSNEVRDRLAARLKMSTRAVQIWFQNRRAKARRDVAEAGKSTLSFAPVPPRQPPSAAVLLEDRGRFDELFQMPQISLQDVAPIYLLPQPAQHPAHAARADSESSGTPLTWDDPMDLYKAWELAQSPPQYAGEPAAARDGDTAWMDA